MVVLSPHLVVFFDNGLIYQNCGGGGVIGGGALKSIASDGIVWMATHEAIPAVQTMFAGVSCPCCAIC